MKFYISFEFIVIYNKPDFVHNFPYKLLLLHK